VIPAELDIHGMLDDLGRWGWRDYKIEIACGLSGGYISQIRCGNIRFLAYQKAARLYNFWFSEQEMVASREALQTRLEAVTT
jgi:hypothetical protein